MKKGFAKLTGILICAALIISAVPFAVSAKTTEIFVSAERIEDYGAAWAIQSALNIANEQSRESDNTIKVVIEPGEYELNGTLHIFSNTWLSMYDVKLTRGPYCKNMLVTGNDDTVNTGATGYYYRGITLEGGTIDGNNAYSNTMVKVVHAKNFVMKNLTLQNNKNAHIMEVAGVDGFTAVGGGLYNQVLESNTGSYEAIQFDVLKSGNMQGCRSEDLSIKNALIENCTFENVPRGVGSHTAVHNNPHNTIVIRNNTFKDIGSVAVQTLGWANCSIVNNTIDNAPRSIAVYSLVAEGYGTILPGDFAAEGNTEQHYSNDYIPQKTNILIANNVITNGGQNNDPYSSYEKAAISVLGSKVVNSTVYSGGSGGLPVGEYPCDTVTVKNNLLDLKEGSGVRVEHSKTISVDSNVIYCTKTSATTNFYGVVFRDGVNPANITKNYISNPAVNGIHIDSCTLNYISGNEIISAGKYGMGTYASSIGTIQNNDVYYSKTEGIAILSSSKVTTKISENRVSSSNYGIHISGDSAAKLIDKNLTYNCQTNIGYASSTGLVKLGTNYTANAALTTFAVDSKTVNLGIGESWRIGKTVTPANAITTFNYTNSNPDVASIDNTGKITAKAAGTTSIIMKSANGKGLVINVTVINADAQAIFGDVDGDGYVTSADSALLGNYISRLGDYDNINLINADVDRDRKVTASDRIILTRYVDRDPDISSLPYAPLNQDDIRARFSFNSVQAKAGDRVELTLSLDENPGIATVDLDVDFDSNALKLVDVIDNGLIEGATPAHSDHFESPYRLSWENDLAKTDSSATGTLVTLVFEIDENATEGEYAVTVDPNTAEVYSTSLNRADCFVSRGSVEVVKDEPLIGDVDGSGVVDIDDALLLQKHIAKYTDGGRPLIDESDEAMMNIADVNRDGILSVSDVTMIQQYIAGIITDFS